MNVIKNIYNNGSNYEVNNFSECKFISNKNDQIPFKTGTILGDDTVSSRLMILP